MIKIEKGIIKPESTTKREQKYPWDQMEVGDSFLVTGVKLTSTKAMCYKHAPKKFSARLVKDGVRVWRDA